MEIKNFPESRKQFFDQINKDDLYKMPYSGLFRQSMLHFPNEELYIYIPECTHLSSQLLILIPDKDADRLAFFEASGWKAAADTRGFIVAIPDGKILDEALATIIEDVLRRDFYVANKNFIFAAGYGSGAAKAQRMVMNNPMAFAGLFLCGDPAVSAEELAATQSMASEVPGVPRSCISMPVWIATEKITENAQRVIDHWKKANRSESEPYFKDGSYTYFPKDNTNDSLIDELVGGKVIVTQTAEAIEPLKIWDSFLSRYARYAGIGNWNLRLYRTAEEAGVEFKTMYVDGVRREWYQFVPESVKNDPSKKVPLVVSFHGGSNMHRRHIASTQWIKVAQARGFIVVFPAAAMGGFSAKNDWLPHAAWNANKNPKALDDEKFIRLMVEQLIKELPVDKGRVYSSGHSMGSAFGQRALLAMPDVFAAAALTSGVLRGGFFGDYNTPGIVEDHQRPIWIIMGGRDIGGGDYDCNPDTLKYAKYWTQRNATQPWDQPWTYKTGAYATKVYVNSKGVPMVQFSTVDNKHHSATAQDSWFLYDEFLCKYSMDEQGRTVYMNSVVMD